MKKILGYLKDFQRKHFDWKLYLSIGGFLAICFAFNYSLDFENSLRDACWGSFTFWLVMFFWMMFPFIGICLIIRSFGKIPDFITSRRFWVVLIIGFAILATNSSFSGYRALAGQISVVDYKFLTKCIRWSSSLVLNVLPLLLVYRIFETERPRYYYGLVAKQVDLKPYFLLLGIAMLFIGIGSFFTDIQEFYPRYRNSWGDKFAARHDIPAWLSVLTFELAYGSDFVSVELFFRGFLIHAFAKMLGGYAVLAMVGSYAFLHFGKPLTEAVSSIFGGYILGILSYYTRSVWGGIIVHIGVAWTMELFGYLQSLN